MNLTRRFEGLELVKLRISHYFLMKYLCSLRSDPCKIFYAKSLTIFDIISNPVTAHFLHYTECQKFVSFCFAFIFEIYINSIDFQLTKRMKWFIIILKNRFKQKKKHFQIWKKNRKLLMIWYKQTWGQLLKDFRNINEIDNIATDLGLNSVLS